MTPDNLIKTQNPFVRNEKIAACADVVDIGETAYAMVLADDLNGNGEIDLLMATMNGNLYAFQSTAAALPDATWPSQVGSRINVYGLTAGMVWIWPETDWLNAPA